MIFHCPSCNTVIGEIGEPGVAELPCPSCGYRYRVLTGEVTDRSSRQVTLRRQTTRQTGVYERAYELGLSLPESPCATVSFAVPGREDSVLARQGERVSVVQSLRNDTPEELLSLVNHTSGDVYTFTAPGARSRQNALYVGGGAGLVVFLISAAFVGGWALIPGGLTAFLLYRLCEETFAPTHLISPAEEAVLTHSLGLLEQKREMAQRLEVAHADLTAKEGMKAKLRDLREKMVEVGAELYRSRIDAIDAAMRTIDQQVEIDRQLVDGYGKTIKMLEIELESRARTDELPDDIVAVLEAKNRELADLREHNEDLQRLLAANDEVDRLLRGG